MIEIRFDNPEQQQLPMTAEFKTKLAALGVDFQKQEQAFTVTTQSESLPERAMGEPISFSLIVAFVITHQTEITAFTKLAVFLKAVRDLYVSFLSERKLAKDRTERSDKLKIVAPNKIAIDLPTTDAAIDEFVESLKK